MTAPKVKPRTNGWCRACGAPCLVLVVRYCSPCLVQMTEAFGRVGTVVPYARLLDKGESLYDEFGEPLDMWARFEREFAA